MKPVEELTVKRGQKFVVPGNSVGYEFEVLSVGSQRVVFKPLTGLGEPLYLREVTGKNTLYLTDAP